MSYVIRVGYAKHLVWLMPSIWVFSKNRDTPKWIVYNGKPYQEMDDLGVPPFKETPI